MTCGGVIRRGEVEELACHCQERVTLADGQGDELIRVSCGSLNIHCAPHNQDTDVTFQIQRQLGQKVPQIKVNKAPDPGTQLVKRDGGYFRRHLSAHNRQPTLQPPRTGSAKLLGEVHGSGFCVNSRPKSGVGVRRPVIEGSETDPCFEG